MGNPGYLAADGTQTDDAQRLAGGFDKGREYFCQDLAPGIVSGLDRRIEMRRIPQQGENMHHRSLGDGRGGISRYVADGDFPFRTSRDIDVVHPGPGLADQLQLRRCIQDGRRHLELVDDQHIAIPYPLQALLGRGISISDEVAQRFQRGERTGPEGQGIQEYNFHLTSLLRCFQR